MNNYKLVSSLKIIFLCLFAVILSCSTSISLPTWYLSPNNGLDSNKIVSVGSGKKSTDAVLNALVNLIKLQHSEIEGRNERFVEKNDKDEEVWITLDGGITWTWSLHLQRFLTSVGNFKLTTPTTGGQTGKIFTIGSIAERTVLETSSAERHRQTNHKDG